MALTKRLVKGSAITAAEHDANLDHVMDLGNATGELALGSVADIGTGDNLLMTAAERTALGTALQPGAQIPWTDVTGKPTLVTGLSDLSDVDTSGEAEGSILVRRSGVYVPEAKPTSSGEPSWGDITGTLSSQTDLQTALDAKADEADLGTAAGSDTGDFATAAQGATADTALQPADLDPTFTALSTSRDSASGDDGADIECTAAATLTIVAGTITRGCTITQMGGGAATIAAGAGVTINKESDVQAVTNGQYAVAFLKPTGTTDTFILTGSLAAV